jgi:hypothetical protein
MQLMPDICGSVHHCRCICVSMCMSYYVFPMYCLLTTDYIPVVTCALSSYQVYWHMHKVCLYSPIVITINNQIYSHQYCCTITHYVDAHMDCFNYSTRHVKRITQSRLYMADAPFRCVIWSQPKCQLCGQKRPPSGYWQILWLRYFRGIRVFGSWPNGGIPPLRIDLFIKGVTLAFKV